jgi:hypothetical protein
MFDKIDYSQYELDRSNHFEPKNLKDLREKFKITYCAKKGWNPLELTMEQINEISNQKGYKNPDMILS